MGILGKFIKGLKRGKNFLQLLLQLLCPLSEINMLNLTLKLSKQNFHEGKKVTCYSTLSTTYQSWINILQS